MKFLEEWNVTSISWLDFRVDLDHDADTEIFSGIFVIEG